MAKDKTATGSNLNTIEQIYQAVDRFDRAVRAHAWRGSGHPADIPNIEREYDAALCNLKFIIRKEVKWGDKK